MHDRSPDRTRALSAPHPATIARDAAAGSHHPAAGGIRRITPADAEWPATLLLLGAAAGPPDGRAPAPQALWLSGHGAPASLTGRCIALVGTGLATPYGEHVAADLAHDLARRGWTVLSTGGHGIAAAAHRGALAADVPTIAVLGHGPDHTHSQSNAHLLRRIQDRGLLLSQYPPGSVPSRSRSLARDRLVVALARATVIVEAVAREDTLLLADWAAHLRRPLLAVPGPVTSAASAGCHRLLRTGDALLATDATAVLDVVAA